MKYPDHSNVCGLNTNLLDECDCKEPATEVVKVISVDCAFYDHVECGMKLCKCSCHELAAKVKAECVEVVKELQGWNENSQGRMSATYGAKNGKFVIRTAVLEAIEAVGL